MLNQSKGKIVESPAAFLLVLSLIYFIRVICLITKPIVLKFTLNFRYVHLTSSICKKTKIAATQRFKRHSPKEFRMIDPELTGTFIIHDGYRYWSTV